MGAMFRDLTEKEIESFKQWARENYKPFEDIRGVFHPVIQMECVLMNIEYNNSLKGE